MSLTSQAKKWKTPHIRVEFASWSQSPGYAFYLVEKGSAVPLLDIRDVVEAKQFADNMRRLRILVDDSGARWTALSSR